MLFSSSEGKVKSVQKEASIKGRGTEKNPSGRFERFQIICDESEDRDPRTEFFREASRRVISSNNSPDIGYDRSLNPYRGCEHGCAYCYARPTHEYFGLSSGLDFETKIFVKEDASQRLRQELSSKAWQPQLIALSGVTDPYQPIERKLQITRKCLEVLAEFRNPVAIVTKNHLVTRDLDLLKQLASHRAVSVSLSVTTLDRQLQGVLEPRTSTPDYRLQAIARLSDAGIPVRALVAPVIPGLTDHEIPAILKAVKDAGAWNASYQFLRMPFGLKELFEHWLETHRPLRKERVLSRIREVRSGRLNDSRFFCRMSGEGIYADHVRALFESTVRKLQLDRPMPELSIASFDSSPQLRLF